MFESDPFPAELITQHPRTFDANKFVYPVLSRRSRGISVGINLNPDKICNFDCIYCQVDRRSEAETKFVETDRLLGELDGMLELVTSGAIYDAAGFSRIPRQLRRLNDIAFSGDGEPTTYRNFDEIVVKVAAMKRRRRLDDVKLVLITNASMFHRPGVGQALRTLDANNGEIWAKLETGTEQYYRKVERTTVPFRRILENITAAARLRPIVIQSLFMRIQGEAPPPEELDAYYRRLEEIGAGGGQIKLVQVYTVARRPAESYVQPLPSAELEKIAEQIRTRTGIAATCYEGTEGERST